MSSPTPPRTSTAAVPYARRQVLISPRTVVGVVLVVALFLALVEILGLIGTVLRLLVVAGFLTVVLNPLVNALQRRGLGRGPATLVVFAGLLLALAAFFGAFLAPLYTEVRAFSDNAPQYIEDLRRSALLRDLDERYDILERAQAEAANLPERLPATAPAALGLAGTVFNAIFQTVTVLFLTLFMLLELPSISAAVQRLLTPGPRRHVNELTVEINRTVARYVAGNLLISLIAGTTAAVALLVLGVPYAFVLGLFMAIADLVPLVGATAGGFVIVLVAFTQGVVPGVVMIVVMIVYQQVENQVLQPLIMKRTVAVSPLVVLVSVLVGGTLLGVLGALLAIPAAGSAQILLRQFLEARRRHVEAVERAETTTAVPAAPAAAPATPAP